MKKPTILVVDDSKPILCLLKVVLGRKFNVFAAVDGFEAMNWLMDSNRPDIIISDLEMPNIDGSELISYIANSTYYENIPVLVLSGAPDDEIKERCAEMGIADYLSKPFDPAELLKKINKVLEENASIQKRSLPLL